MPYWQWLVNKTWGRPGLLRRALASLDLTEARKTDIRGVFEELLSDVRAFLNPLLTGTPSVRPQSSRQDHHADPPPPDN